MKNISLLVVAAALVAAAADKWAVLVCGSSGYGNYRHHADVCHSYQHLVKNGVPEDHIITMLYDDVAQDPSNPYPGKLFNKPTDGSNPGVDVYHGCKKSYTGSAVTADNFLAILTGNATAVQGGSGEVLKSGPDDQVFVSFVDHGGPGLVAMPVGPFLYQPDLTAALETMHNRSMYQQLVFYMEACESGSMFQSLPDSLNIYATTASNPNESSWGCYCPPYDYVAGVELDTCLGDLYSVSWMEDADAADPKTESLETQFETVLKETNLSTPMQWGDLKWTNEPIGLFEGGAEPLHASRLGRTHKQHRNASSDAFTAAARASVSSPREATLLSLRLRAGRATGARKASLQRELAELEAGIARITTAITRLSVQWFATDDVELLLSRPVCTHEWSESQWSCYKDAIASLQDSACGKLDDWSMRYLRVVAAACEAYGDLGTSYGSNAATSGGIAVAESVQAACTAAAAAEAATAPFA